MKKILILSTAFAALLITGCRSVDATYTSARGIGQAAIGGTGKIVGSAASDSSKTLSVATDAAGKVLSGGGKVVGGALELVGGVVRGTSEIVAPDTDKGSETN
jgi:hypothetical protein